MEKEKKNRSWKRLAALTAIFSIIFCFSGCLRYRTTATVHKDGTVDIEILYAMVNSYENANDVASAGLNFDEIKDKAELGWSLEEYHGDQGDEYDYYGYYLRKEGIKMEDLPKELKALDLGFENFTLTEENGEYVLNWDASSSTSEAGSAEDDSGALLMDGYMEFVLKVPGKVYTNNATSTSGKTLTWNLLSQPSPYARFKLTGGGTPIWLIVAIAVVCAGIIAAVVIVIVNKNKNKYVPTYRTPSELAAIDLNQNNNWNAASDEELFAERDRYEEESSDDSFAPVDDTYETEDKPDDVLTPSSMSSNPNTPIWARPSSNQDTSFRDSDHDSGLF